MFDGNKGQQNIGANYSAACLRIDGPTIARITQCRMTASSGIYATGGTNHVHFTGCNIDNCAAWSIHLDAADSALTDRQLSFGGKSAFDADGSIFGNLRFLRDNNLVDHCHIWQAAGPNVLFQQVRSGTITVVYRTGGDNVGDNTRRSGIHPTSGASRCMIHGNRIGQRVKSFGSESYLEQPRYRIYDAGSMNMIRNNFIERPELAGIFAAASSRQAKITFNDIFGVAGSGVDVQGQEPVVEGNDCTLCATGVNRTRARIRH